MRLFALLPTSWLAMVLLSIFAGSVHAQADKDERAQLARQVQKTVEQLQAVRREKHEAEQSHNEKTQRLTQQIDRLTEDRSRVESRAAKLKKRVEQRRAELERVKQARERARQLLQTAAEAATPIARATADRVRQGIPFSREARTKRIDAALGALKTDSPKAAGKGMIELLGFFRQELERAGQIKLTNRPVLLDGGKRRVHADVLRIGLAEMMFVSEDGQRVGLAAEKPGPAWRFDLSEQQRQRIRSAAGILRQQRPAELIGVPVSVAAASAQPSRNATQPAHENP